MRRIQTKKEYKYDYAKQFEGIKSGKDDFHAFCIPCKDEINLKAMGKAAITQHQQKQKHKDKVEEDFQDNDSLPSLYKLVSIELSIQLANGVCGANFLLCKTQYRCKKFSEGGNGEGVICVDLVL